MKRRKINLPVNQIPQKIMNKIYIRNKLRQKKTLHRRNANSKHYKLSP